MTRIRVAPDQVAAIGSALAEVATMLGDYVVLGPRLGWLPHGPMADALEEVLTTWERARLALEREAAELAATTARVGAAYLEAEDETLARLRLEDPALREVR